MKNRIKAFTLIELIVTLIIIIILWVIAYISYQSYSSNARDSIRIGDINNVKKSLELFLIQTWKYPVPDNAKDITYSGTIVWKQWTIWDKVTSQLSRNLSKKPIDPLYNTEYIYSVLEDKSKYEIMSLHERGIAFDIKLINTTYASAILTPKIDWTYNQLFVKTIDYIIPTPSIITALDTSWWVELNAETLKSQVVNEWRNIPDIGVSGIQTVTWSLTGLSLSVYDWSINENLSAWAVLEIYNAINTTYKNSTLADSWLAKYLLNQTTDNNKILVIMEVAVNDINPSDVMVSNCIFWTSTFPCSL